MEGITVYTNYTWHNMANTNHIIFNTGATSAHAPYALVIMTRVFDWDLIGFCVLNRSPVMSTVLQSAVKQLSPPD